MYYHLKMGLLVNPSIFGNALTVGTMYTVVKSALFSVMIYLTFPLFILFQILGWLEPKKK